jgi:hypothetical protein
MSDHLEILESAISDVGHWRWWVADLPKTFQVEFAGVQLWSPPTQPGGPPCGVFALRFCGPILVAFLTDPKATKLPPDWRQALHEDRIESFPVAHDQFTLRSAEALNQFVEGCHCEYLVGSKDVTLSSSSAALLGFRAGPVGIAIKAQELQVLSSAGTLSPDQIAEFSKAWWTYWRDYWRRRDTDSPMPKDYACEVTLPAKPDAEDQ